MESWVAVVSTEIWKLVLKYCAPHKCTNLQKLFKLDKRIPSDQLKPLFIDREQCECVSIW